MARIGGSRIGSASTGPVMVLRGDKALMRALRQLPIKVELRVIRPAVNFAMTPTVKAARRNAPKGGTGLLKLSIAKKVKAYKRTGVVFGAVGPRTRLFGVVRGRKESPTKYAHIVEGGSRRHDIPRAGRNKVMRLPSGRGFVSHVSHPGTTGQHFLLRAWNQTKGTMFNRMRTKIGRGIQKEARKLAKLRGVV